MGSTPRTSAPSILKSVLVALLVALPCFAGVWVVTVNVDISYHAITHHEIAPAAAFQFGFRLAAAGSAAAFLLTYYGIRARARRGSR